jgi:hypothetical protein
MPLSDIVNVVITRQTQTVTEQGFGTPMILGSSNHFTDLIRFYTSLDEVALDFGPDDPEYIAAQDIFSQTISPDRIAIGRRLVNNVQILVETAMTNEDYILNINGNDLVSNSSSTTTYSVATLNADLVPENRVNVVVNGTTVGTITSQIDFNMDFASGDTAVATINGSPIAGVPYVTSQAVTIGNLATALQATAAIATATVTGPRQITATFAAPGANTINSIITTGGAAPTATISQGGFVFTGDTATTMGLIAAQIELLPNIDSAAVNPENPRQLTVQGPSNTTATITSFVVQGGASQATATIVNPLQAVTPASIAGDIVANVLAEVMSDPSYPVTAVDNGNGLFTLQNRTPGVPWTLKVSTTIANPNAARVRITQIEPNQVYTVTINGIDFSYTSPNNVQTADQIATVLVDLINAVTSTVPVDAENNNDGSFEVTSSDPNQTFSISVSPEIMSAQTGLIVQPLVAANPVATDLTNINNVDSSWYALISVERDPAVVKAIADWVEPRIKLFGTASANLDIINVAAGTDTTSIAAVLNQGGYIRTFVMYHQDAATDYPEAAWFGRVLPLEPGSETWKFKTLNSISYSNLTTTQSRNALNKKANTYEFVAGVGITANGTVAQGEYIDIIRGVDWLTARIQEYVFSALVNTPKVPYTDAGIAVIQAQVKRVLQLGVNNNFLAADPEPECTVPLAADVPPADKANRILKNVKFNATLAGAIHAVEIRGTVSV